MSIIYNLGCYWQSYGIHIFIEIMYMRDKNTKQTITKSPDVNIELAPNKLIHNNEVNNKDRLFPIYPLERVREWLPDNYSKFLENEFWGEFTECEEDIEKRKAQQRERNTPMPDLRKGFWNVQQTPSMVAAIESSWQEARLKGRPSFSEWKNKLRYDENDRIPKHKHREVSFDEFASYVTESILPEISQHRLCFLRHFGLPDDAESYAEFKELFLELLLEGTPYHEDWRKILPEYVCPKAKRVPDANEDTRAMYKGIANLRKAERDMYGVRVIYA
eukprot:snap_masked-scaffold_104-processed-gene-0.6-mRNA-1 protein AED:1.00 eAED:1.00 QI:0/0/0/0/1/1/2/0/274